jgi:hypothetical protein
MTWQLTSLGVTVWAHGYSRSDAALARINTLAQDAAANADRDRAALDYLLATTQAELCWIRGFASSTRSGQPRRPRTDGVQR